MPSGLPITVVSCRPPRTTSATSSSSARCQRAPRSPSGAAATTTRSSRPRRPPAADPAAVRATARGCCRCCAAGAGRPSPSGPGRVRARRSPSGAVAPTRLPVRVTGHEPTPFSLDVADADARVVVTVVGELDLATAGELEAVVLPAVRDGRHAILDLRGLEFMDSSGVRVVVAAHSAAEEHGGRLSLVRTEQGSPVQRILEISGLEGILDLVDAP